MPRRFEVTTRRRAKAVDDVPFAMSAKNLIGVVMGLTHPTADIDRIHALYRACQIPLDDLVTRTYKLEDINLGYEDIS